MQRQPLKKGGKLNRVCAAGPKNRQNGQGRVPPAPAGSRGKRTQIRDSRRGGASLAIAKKENTGQRNFRRQGWGQGSTKESPPPALVSVRGGLGGTLGRLSCLTGYRLQPPPPPPPRCPHAAPGCTTSRKRKKDQRDISAYFAFRL